MSEEISSQQYSTENVANLIVLTNKIFHANLAQQNAIAHQQAIAQIELVALAKCTQALLDADTSDPKAIEQMSARIIEMFEHIQAKSDERLVANQKRMDELFEKIGTIMV